MKMNKKAYYRFADIGMFFLCFVIIAVGIFIGIYIFYSSTIDVREQEAKIIYDKLVMAIIDNGELNQKILEANSENEFDIFKEAKLDKNIVNEDYYFKIEIFTINNELIKKIEEGNRDFEVECFLESKKFPKCYQKEFNLVNSLQENYKIKVLTASNQLGDSI